MKVAAIIPAFNEEHYVAAVIRAIKAANVVSEIIVVDDGSTDSTSTVAAREGAEVVRLSKNVGKGGAMKAGANRTRADILLFLDADLIGLDAVHIHLLVDPITNQGVDMTVGLFKRGRLWTDVAQQLTPFLSGQRAMRRFIIDELDGVEATGYAVERAVTRYTKEHGLAVMRIPLHGVTHVTKEEKNGLLGLRSRLRMYKEIAQGKRHAE